MSNLFTPNSNFFSDDIPSKEDKEKLARYSQTLSELVSLGTHILGNFWEKDCINTDTNSVIAGFFRRILETLDATAVLVKVGSIDPAHNQLRVLLELALTFEYLLEEDTERRAYSYIVSDVHRRLKYYDDPIVSEVIKAPNSHVEVLKNLLTKEELATVEAEYVSKSQTRRGQKIVNKEPKWYNLFSTISNFGALAVHLNRMPLYKVMYGYSSNFTHGTDLLIGKFNRTANNDLELQSIRQFEEALEFSQTVLELGVISFNALISSECFTPEEKETYHKHLDILKNNIKS